MAVLKRVPALVTNPTWEPVEPHSVLIAERAQFIGLLLAWGAWGSRIFYLVTFVTKA